MGTFFQILFIFLGALLGCIASAFANFKVKRRNEELEADNRNMLGVIKRMKQ